MKITIKDGGIDILVIETDSRLFNWTTVGNTLNEYLRLRGCIPTGIKIEVNSDLSEIFGECVECKSVKMRAELIYGINFCKECYERKKDKKGSD